MRERNAFYGFSVKFQAVVYAFHQIRQYRTKNIDFLSVYYQNIINLLLKAYQSRVRQVPNYCASTF